MGCSTLIGFNMQSYTLLCSYVRHVSTTLCVEMATWSRMMIRLGVSHTKVNVTPFMIGATTKIAQDSNKSYHFFEFQLMLLLLLFQWVHVKVIMVHTGIHISFCFHLTWPSGPVIEWFISNHILSLMLCYLIQAMIHWQKWLCYTLSISICEIHQYLIFSCIVNSNILLKQNVLLKCKSYLSFYNTVEGRVECI